MRGTYQFQTETFPTSSMSTELHEHSREHIYFIYLSESQQSTDRDGIKSLTVATVR